MNESPKEQTPSPEELLAQATAQYEQYLDIANISQISVLEVPEERDVVRAPVPLGLVLWPS